MQCVTSFLVFRDYLGVLPRLNTMAGLIRTSKPVLLECKALLRWQDIVF